MSSQKNTYVALSVEEMRFDIRISATDPAFSSREAQAVAERLENKCLDAIGILQERFEAQRRLPLTEENTRLKEINDELFKHVGEQHDRIGFFDRELDRLKKVLFQERKENRQLERELDEAWRCHDQVKKEWRRAMGRLEEMREDCNELEEELRETRSSRSLTVGSEMAFSRTSGAITKQMHARQNMLATV